MSDIINRSFFNRRVRNKSGEVEYRCQDCDRIGTDWTYFSLFKEVERIGVKEIELLLSYLETLEIP